MKRLIGALLATAGLVVGGIAGADLAHATVQTHETCANVYRSGVSPGVVARVCATMRRVTDDSPAYPSLGYENLRVWNPDNSDGNGAVDPHYAYAAIDRPGSSSGDFYTGGVVDGSTWDSDLATSPPYQEWDWPQSWGTLHVQVDTDQMGCVTVYMSWASSSVVGGCS